MDVASNTQETPAVAPPRVHRKAMARLFTFALLALLSLGEFRVFERLLFNDPPEYGFVLANVTGVLEGRPVSKSWQHRLIGPMIVSGLGAASNSLLEADKTFYQFTLFLSNWLLFELTRRKCNASHAAGATQMPRAIMHPWIGATVATAAFGLAHLLLVYRLEYPWDCLDVLIFLVFGYLVWRGRPSWLLAPLLFIGTFNHETILYIPLWYFLDALIAARPWAHRRRDILIALSSAVPIAASILSLRQLLYVGRPNLPGQVFEELTPVISNHWHLKHNVSHLLIENWSSNQVFISLVLLVAMAWLFNLIRNPRHRTASLWSLLIIASIFCFGYINETRHYLSLMAFWVMYLPKSETPVV
jgi:hypothetical protein